MECRVDYKSGFIKIGDVNDLKTLPFYIEKGKNTPKKKKQARVFMSLNKPIMGHKSETEEGGLTLTGPNPKSNHTSPSLPLTDPGRVSFTAHVTST